eukprot:10040893-Lingulodinium_polyedra.AAC.1
MARAVTRHAKQAYAETANFDYAKVIVKDEGQEMSLLVGRGPRGEVFCRKAPRKGLRMLDLDDFLAVMKARYPSIQIRCDQEEALTHVVFHAADKQGLPRDAARLEVPQANGRAEQGVRTVRELLQVLREDLRRRGRLTQLNHPAMKWLVRHAEWLANHVVKSDVMADPDGVALQ